MSGLTAGWNEARSPMVEAGTAPVIFASHREAAAGGACNFCVTPDRDGAGIV
jgi:hypothetical protein